MARFVVGRYPALLLGVLSTLVQMLVAFGVPLSDTQALTVNGIVTAALGLLTAALVARDRLLPAILALGQAGFDLFIGFGWHMTDAQVSTAMAFLAALSTAVAAFVHAFVDAPLDANGVRRPKVAMAPRARAA